MNNTILRKKEQLEENISSATNKLLRNLIFNFIKETNKDLCYRCNEKILTLREMSIDHKINWLDSDNPKELFFNLDNIAFSHLGCNARHTRKTKYFSKEEREIAKFKRQLELNRGAVRKKLTVPEKVTKEQIQWAKDNTELSLREKARRLGIHHETLRRKLL